ncbi:MAG TPA: hypothetical protein VFJ58_02200 [Armatimonadota bacterium]|nr:hypothetical protein [Armatimonadota bacterium]
MNRRTLISKMTFALGGLPAMVLADPPAPTPAPAPAAVKPATAAEQVSRITLYRQLNALGLTPGQVSDIGRRLTQLAAADRDYTSKQVDAGKSVAPALQRIEDAVFLGRAPDAADEAQAGAALSPLAPDGERVARLRTQTIDAIRAELRPQQMTAIRGFLGIPPEPLPLQNGAGSFIKPRMLTGPGGPGGPATPAGGPANPTGGTSRPPDPLKMIKDLMDRYRRMPQIDFDDQKHHAANGNIMMNMNGVSLTDPDFAAENNGVSFFDEMAQLRQMSDAEYQADRAQLAVGLSQQFDTYRASHPQSAIMAEGPGALITAGQSAETALNNEAVRRFFLQPDTLRYLQARLPR